VKERELQESFSERGYVTPGRLFSSGECQSLLARLRQEQQRWLPLDWPKGWAATSAEFYALGAHDRILDLVTSLLGEDVVLWGASLLNWRPGYVHPWHTDIESSSPTGETVSVWIGLADANPQASLKVAPYSHRFGMTVQQLTQAKGADPRSVSDAELASWARDRDRRSGVVPVDNAGGEALLFDGRLWHGSHNLARRTRSAVLLQYASARTAIRIPLRGGGLRELGDHDVVWPFTSYQVPKPPCIVVSGRDGQALNRLVPGPASADGHRLPALSSRIDPLRLPLDHDPEAGWKPHALFQGATSDIKAMRCHVSILDPDHQAHPPHRHDEEELLAILDGEADLVHTDATNPAQTLSHHVRRASFAYYPAGFSHSIRNTSSRPVTYMMVKWTADRMEHGEPLDHRVIHFPGSDAEVDRHDLSGLSRRRLLDGETWYLRRLRAHVATMQPGASHGPDVGAHDAVIAVLEGTVEALGERIGPHSVIFYAAGEPRGMRSVADVPAVCLVLEFLGRHSTCRPADHGRLSRRVWRLVRDRRLPAG
jgi:mannose-6-phosphate isomerase-like protein (cupin superfamily)